MSEWMKFRKCVKCSEMATLTGLDPSSAIYCKPCFIHMVKHKFSSMIGKKRLYKDGEKRETLIVFEGDPQSALLISLVAQGLKADVHKRLTLIPTVLVLLTVSHEETVDSIKRQIASFREMINARWIFAHISAIFCSNDEFGDCDSIGNAESIAKWKRLMNGRLSESVRSELIRLSRNLICLRIAENLKINKVMLADSADQLAECAIHSLVFARGSSVSCLSGAVDRRYSGITIVRPLRDVSRKEIAIVNRFEGSDRFIIYVEEKNLGSVMQRPSIQTATSEFISNLQSEGFRSTVATILSTAAKLQSATTSKNQCHFCFAMYQPEFDMQRFCFACLSLFEEIDEKELIDEIFIYDNGRK